MSIQGWSSTSAVQFSDYAMLSKQENNSYNGTLESFTACLNSTSNLIGLTSVVAYFFKPILLAYGTPEVKS
jgi:predicted ATPase